MLGAKRPLFDSSALLGSILAFLKRTPPPKGSPWCPIVGGECWGDRCQFWTHLRGEHPQGGGEMDMRDCAIKWLAPLTIDVGRQVVAVGAELEAMRNQGAANAGIVSAAIKSLDTSKPEITIEGQANETDRNRR